MISKEIIEIGVGLQIKEEKIKTSEKMGVGVQRKLEEIEKNGNKFDGESLGGSSAKNDHRVPDLSPDPPPWTN